MKSTHSLRSALTLATLVICFSASGFCADALEIVRELPVGGELKDAKNADHRNPVVVVEESGAIHVGLVAVDRQLTVFGSFSSTDGGKSFADMVTLSESRDSPAYGTTNRPCGLSAAAGQVIYLWPDKGTGSDDIDQRISVSTDGGKTFGRRRAVETKVPDSYQGGADIALMEEGQLVVAWVDWRAGRAGAGIYAAVSSDLGEIWDHAEEPWAETTSPLCGVRLAQDRDKLYFAHRIPSEGELHDPSWVKVEFPRNGLPSARKPQTVQRRKKGQRWRDAPSDRPGTVVINSTGVMGCAWRDGEDKKAVLLFSLSKNRGSSWSKPVVIDETPETDPVFPQLVMLPGGDLLATWEGFDNDSATIFLSRSSDSGSTWSAPQKLRGEALSVGRTPHDGTVVLGYRVRDRRTSRCHLAFVKAAE